MALQLRDRDVSDSERVFDKALAEEFRSRPYGRHSPALQHLLNRFRLAATPPHYVLVCRQPGREWVLGRLGARRGEPIEVLEDQVFDSREEAEWMRFRLRWQAATGDDPEGS